MRVLASRHRDVLSGESRLKREAQGVSRRGAAFLLGTFLWPFKEKYLAFGCENPIKKNRGEATP